MSDELRDYVSKHREDIHYALLEGDRYVRTIVIAALIKAGDADIKLAKHELEAAQEGG